MQFSSILRLNLIHESLLRHPYSIKQELSLKTERHCDMKIRSAKPDLQQNQSTLQFLVEAGYFLWKVLKLDDTLGLRCTN